MNLGKIFPKQLTEKELKEAEEIQAKNKKVAPPPKDNKNKGGEEIKPSPEELEKQKKQELERLEAEKKSKEEWDALDEKTKFHRTYEDRYKNASIKWEKSVGTNEKINESQLN